MLNWHLLAERRILAAMERGEFDDLPGKGQPLQWEENPFVPPEWQLAFDLLKRAGLAPDWIMCDREIRAGLEALADKRRQQRLWMEARRAAIASMSAEEQRAERARLRQVQEQTWGQMRDSIERLNQKIAEFNLIVPIARLQRRPLDLERERASLQAAWGELEKEDLL